MRNARTFLLFVSAATALPLSSIAQATVPEETADARWSRLQDRMGRSSSVAGLSSLVEKADQAKAFYTTYPKDPRANTARRFEILALLTAGDQTDAANERRVQEAASALRSDTAVPESERAIVAGFVAFHDAGNRLKNPADRLQVYETVARDLIREFPNQPQGYESLLTLAAENDDPHARVLAQELISGKPPQHVKIGAKRLLARLELKGKQIDRILGLRSGGKDRKPLVVYFWASWSPASMTLARYLATRDAGAAEFVGVNLDTKNGRAAAERAALDGGFPGTQRYEPDGPDSALADQLGVDAIPSVYFADSRGRVEDVRGTEDLDRKLAALGL